MVRSAVSPGYSLKVADIPSRRALRSACTDCLEVPYFKLSTIGAVRRPSFSGCRLTDLELITRHSRFGINTAGRSSTN